MIDVLAYIFSWLVPVNVLLRMAPKDHAVQAVPRSWLPPRILKLKRRIMKGDKASG